MKPESERSEGKPQKQNRKVVWKILLIICIVGLLICTGLLIGKQMGKHRAQQDMANLTTEHTEATDTQELSTEEQRNTICGVEIPEKQLDWETIQNENPDIYAWIYIPGTEVDYPVLQHPTDNSYYLNHNIDGSSGYPGCIYTENVNTKTFEDPNTVLYGHDMKDGSMFASLHNYRDPEFFQNNPYVFIYTPTETYVYEIYEACEFSDVHLFYEYDFTDPADYGRFLTDIAGVREMDTQIRKDMTITTEEKVLTMSTCIATKPNNRYLVIAKQLHD